MSEVIRVLAVIAIIGYVVGRQLLGEPLRGKRVVVLPVILAVAGVADLGEHGRHVELADVICLVIAAHHDGHRAGRRRKGRRFQRADHHAARD